ncbi:MAG: ester cyclase, partial [Burkholderiaceae bacterium]
GTHTGPFGDLPPTGKVINIDVMDLFQIREGVLIEHWALLDNKRMDEQLSMD